MKRLREIQIISISKCMFSLGIVLCVLTTSVKGPVPPPGIYIPDPNGVIEVFPDQHMMDILLNWDSVIQFLNSFHSEEKRLVVKEQLRRCPIVPLCGFSFKFLEYMEQLSCCEACSCDINSCLEKNTCCPDILPDHMFTEQSPYEVEKPCTLAKIKEIPETDSIAYFMFSRCSNDSDTDTNMLCNLDYASQFDRITDLADILPVTRINDSAIFRNRHCATCRGVSAPEMKSWIPKLYCDGAIHFDSENDLIRQILMREVDCDLTFEPHDHRSVFGDRCDLTKNTCNDGNERDSHACSLYRSSVHMEKIHYQNVFCAFCNNVTELDLQCTSVGPGPSKTFSFSGLLRLERDATSTTEPSMMACNKTSVFDNVTQSCIGISCSEMRRPKDGKCEIRFTETGTLEYHMYVRLTMFNSGKTINISTSYQLADHIIDWFVDRINNLSNTNSSMYWYDVCGAQVVYKSNHVFHSSDESTESLARAKLMYIDVRLELVVRSWHNPEKAAADLNRLDMTDIIIEADEFYKLTGRVMDSIGHVFDRLVILSNWLALSTSSSEPLNIDPVMPFLFEDKEDGLTIVPHLHMGSSRSKCMSYILKVRSLQFPTCPLVTLERKSHPWKVVGDGLILAGTDQLLGLEQYRYSQSRNVIKVCLDIYLDLMRKSSRFKSESLTVKGWLSIILIAASVLSLLVTFVVYCISTSLRTLPGLNNMALIVNMLLAQSLYLLASFGGFDTDSIVCKAIGLAMHFFWLSTLFWMNVCTFHMYTVLTGTKIERSAACSKKYVLYHSYCFFMSVAMVIVNVAVSLTRSEFSDVGYGGRVCYISSQLMMNATFGAPVCCVVVVNIFLFCRLVFSMLRTTNVHKHSQNNRNEFVIFLKLSTITGITWVFGFLFQWTVLEIFEYLFIIFNGGQGIFIMASFVLNKRVFTMLRQEVRRLSQTKRQSSTSSSTAKVTVTKETTKK